VHKNINKLLAYLFGFQIDEDIAEFDLEALQEIFGFNVFHIHIEGGIDWPLAESRFGERKRG